MIYGVTLLPDAETIERMLHFAHKVTAASSSAISCVSADAIPHLSLVHAESNTDEAGRWWHEVARSITANFSATLTGLMFSPLPVGDYYVPEGGIYFGLEVLRSAALYNAHHEVLEIASRVGAVPVGAIGDNFRPHITLGILREFPSTRLILPSDITAASIQCTVAFGQIRRYGQLGPDFGTTTTADFLSPELGDRTRRNEDPCPALPQTYYRHPAHS